MEYNILNIEGEKFYILDSQEKEIAFVKYSIQDNIMDIRSVFVDSSLRGKDMGNFILDRAISYAQNNNYKIIPTCPFVQKRFAQNRYDSSLLAK